MGSSSKHKQFPVREPMPQELTNLQNGLYQVMMSGLTPILGSDWMNGDGQGGTTNWWQQQQQTAQDISKNAQNAQNNLIGQYGTILGNQNNLTNDWLGKLNNYLSQSDKTQSQTNDRLQQMYDRQDQLNNNWDKLYAQLAPIANKNDSIVDKMVNTVDSGNIPSKLTDALNASVNQQLQSNMGTALNGLGSRGVLNSSITGNALSNLAGNAADAYNKNYMNAFNSVLSGYSSALSGSQGNYQNLLGGLGAIDSNLGQANTSIGNLNNTLNNANNLLGTQTGALNNAYGNILNNSNNTLGNINNAIGTLGQVPTQAYQNQYAAVTPIYNMWKDWYGIYKGSQDYDNYVKEGK